MNNILVLDNSAYIRHRIKGILKKHSIEAYEAVNSNEFFSIMSRHKDNIGLIITEVDLGKEDGLDIIANAKRKGHDIPFIVLTGQNKKGIFIRSIESGASDYILKPFDDDFLLDRIMGKMNFGYESEETLDKRRVSMDFNRYISGEMKKAEKGRYELSVFMSVISRKDCDCNGLNERNCDEVFRLAYPKLKNLFWDTDIFMGFGNQSYFGVLPFCTLENTKIVEDKIKGVFEEIVEKNNGLEGHCIETAFVTYPNEIESYSNLFVKLKEKLLALDTDRESEFNIDSEDKEEDGSYE